jgi:hypothetical protein
LISVLVADIRIALEASYRRKLRAFPLTSATECR